MIEMVDPCFEMKNGGIRALKRLFELKGELAQPWIKIAKSDMVNGQLHEKDRICATNASKVMTRAVNKLKMGSKTDEVLR